ncbi:MAG: histidinol-phosphate transaminase [Thermodesulfobacteriota bacterium]
MDVRSLIRAEVLDQTAYPVETTPCRIKLDANESPLTLPTPLRKRFAERLAAAPLNRYPEAGSLELAARFAKSYAVGADQVILGNGSDDLIQILCQTCAGPGASVMIPVPTFVMYRIIALNTGLQVASIPLDGGFDLDLPAMREQLTMHSPALTFLAWPNNPTGNCFSRDRIEAILEAASGIVVVDEAYFHFAEKTFLPEIGRYENLVILRSLSKVGLAAMRIGLLVGPSTLIRELNKVRLPYNLNSLSQAAAGFYLDEEETFLDQAAQIRRWRSGLFSGLEALPGIHPWPTEANFIFFSCDFDANRIYKQLIQRGILIRNFSAPGRMQGFMRVTVGTGEENREFLDVLRDITAK